MFILICRNTKFLYIHIFKHFVPLFFLMDITRNYEYYIDWSSSNIMWPNNFKQNTQIYSMRHVNNTKQIAIMIFVFKGIIIPWCVLLWNWKHFLKVIKTIIYMTSKKNVYWIISKIIHGNIILLRKYYIKCIFIFQLFMLLGMQNVTCKHFVLGG